VNEIRNWNIMNAMRDVALAREAVSSLKEAALAMRVLFIGRGPG
jgi:hypothetical protein